ncbi:hypothetical protein DW886_14695 [Enterocloster aldenensis]|uniref:hypothetical protein n=1 Tax=Enterocloster aldenensis TaxID=358742 RepID=UPI000E50AA69|nr:hypothetical protein DW886_14695 [Enterocloster aldenensis]
MPKIIMKRYIVSFMKQGELFETVVIANSSDEARGFIANKYNIPFNFELKGEAKMNTYLENNHVGAVILVN